MKSVQKIITPSSAEMETLTKSTGTSLNLKNGAQNVFKIEQKTFFFNSQKCKKIQCVQNPKIRKTIIKCAQKASITLATFYISSSR